MANVRPRRLLPRRFGICRRRCRAHLLAGPSLVSPPPSLNLPWAKSIENAAPSSEKKPRNKNVPIKPRRPPASMRLRQRLTLGASPSAKGPAPARYSDGILGCVSGIDRAVRCGSPGYDHHVEAVHSRRARWRPLRYPASIGLPLVTSLIWSEARRFSLLPPPRRRVALDRQPNVQPTNNRKPKASAVGA